MNIIKSRLRALLRRVLNDPQLPTARVMYGSNLVIEVVAEDGSNTTYTFDRAERAVALEGRVVKMWANGGRRAAGAVSNPHPEWEFQACSGDEAQHLYRSIQRALRQGDGRRPAGFLRPALIGVLAAIAVLMIDAPDTKQVVPAAVAAPMQPQPLSAAGALAAPPAQAVLTADESKMVSALKGIRMPGQGPVYWVFSDPNCPFCKSLDKSIAAVPEFQAVMLPLGYKPGSRDLSAAALCAADPAKEWAKAIEGTSTAKPCEKGYAIVDANMRAFEQLRLTGTPTMVTPKGLLVSGSASPDELRLALR